MKFFCCVKKPTGLTDSEKAYAKRMCGLTHSNTQFNEEFFANMNNAQIEYLLSIVELQDTNFSHAYATYVKRLQKLAESKKIDIPF